jgi:tetratricopeptide (TPR) repeat protein/HEAT repeat protein
MAVWVAPLLAIGALPARAQDDWSITREPRGSSPSSRPSRPSRPEQPRRPRLPRNGGGPRRPPREPRVEPAPNPSTTEAPPPGAGGARNDVLIERYLRVLEADPREGFAFRRLVDLYRERDGNVDRLVAELEARANADASAYAPRMLLGHLYRAQSRADDARAAYQRAAELRPTDPAPSIALAQLQRAAGAVAEARSLYQRALEHTRDRLQREELLREVAQLAMEAGDYEGARGLYEELGRGGDGGVYQRTEYARALAAARQWERAVAEYERVLRALQGDNRVLPPVLLELSRAQLETGAVEPSIETLDRALRAAGAGAGIRAEIYDQLLTAYRRSDRLPELAERLRRDRGFESSELLGRIEDELGNDEAALEAYRRALRGRARDIDTRLRVIQLLTRSGRLDEVVEEYRALIRSAPREPRFVIELAQLLMQTDRREDALRLVRETGQRNPRDPAVHQQLAELYSRWGEDELAAREVELLARIEPNEPAHVIALGAQQFAAGDRDGALATWRRVLGAERDRAAGYATLAGILADHDLLPQAVEAYREAVRLAPDELTYVRGLATALERNRDDEGAEREWQRVLELARDDRPARREARERIVGIWGRSRRIHTRIQELERRFAGQPPDAEAGRFLAEAYRRRGPQHQAQAEQVLERVAEIEPGDVETLLSLERLRTRRGDLAGAIEVLARLRDADPRRAAQYLQRMAEHALALYRDAEAVGYAAEAVQRNPDDASAHRRLADLYRARQDTDRAVASYRRALELNDRLYPVYFELAELYLAGGETAQADRLYRQLLRIAPDDDLVARAARASIQINLGAGTLADLERELLPLTLANPHRPMFRRMAVELYDAYAGPLAVRARRGGEGTTAARAELRQIGTRGIKPLLEALADVDPAQRRVALDILGELGNPSAAAPLLAVAENATLDIGQRTSALLAAGAVAPATLVPRFESIASGGDPRLQGTATWALARLGGRDGTRALRRLLTSGDPAVRGYAVLGLGHHGGSAEAQEIGRLLREDANEEVVLAAAWALGRAGDAGQVPGLVRVLEASGGPAAVVAADALGELGGPDAEAALVRALFQPDASVRRAAARALRRGSRTDRSPRETIELPAPQAFQGVRDYLGQLVESRAEDGSVAQLGRLVPLLEASASEALRGPVEQALAALEVLGPRASGLGLGPLTEGIERWPEPDRSSAEEALTVLSERLTGALVAAAGHLDAAVRVDAVRLLPRLARPDADAALAAALRSPPAAVQRAALEALAASDRAPSSDVSTELAGVLRRHRDWSMRTRAARALARSTSPGSREVLREALAGDEYAFVREAAAAALVAGVTAEDAGALERALGEDSEPRVRLAALRALQALGGEAAQRARRRAASDSSALVRDAN